MIPALRSALALVLAIGLPAAAAVPGNTASPLVFTAARVSAPVVPGATSLWFHMHTNSWGSVAAADFIADSDSDGWVHLERIPRHQATSNLWTVVDMTSGRLMAGELTGTVPRQSEFPPKAFIRDGTGNFSNVIIDVSKMRSSWDFWDLVWVRPGTGAWIVMTADSDTLTDRDRSPNDRIVLHTSSFEPLGDPPAPEGFAAGDLLIGIDAGAHFWFGDAVDTHLNEASGPGVLSAWARSVLNEKSGPLSITVLRRDGAEGTVSVDYATANGTALAGVHYQAVAGTLTFGPGEIVKTVEVPLIDDAVYSGETSFEVRLTDPAGAAFPGPSTVQARILDDDPKPVASLAGEVTRQEGGSGTYEVAFEVRLSGATRVPATMQWSVFPNDGAPNGGTITFQPGETVKPIAFRYTGDALPGADRVYTISLAGLQHATSAGTVARVTVVDDDYASLSVAGASVDENHSFAHVGIVLSAPGRPVTLKYATVDGTAKAGSDYTAVSGTMTIDSRFSSASVSVPILRDNLLDETDETFQLVVTDVSGATVTVDRGTVTIANAVPPNPAMIMDHWSGPESSDATFVLRITPTYRDVTVVATTRAVSALPTYDFVAKTQTLRIPAGESSTTFTVDLVDDQVAEGVETFAVDLTNPVNATFAMYAFAVATIRDDDAATEMPGLMVEDAWKAEGHSGTSNLLVPVRLTTVPSTPVTVRYTTADFTATAGVDYTSSSGTVTIPANQMSAYISIPILGDTQSEESEMFYVSLSSPTGALLARSAAVATIINDDGTPPQQPAVIVRPSSMKEQHAGTTGMPVQIELSRPATSPLDVSYGTADGTANEGVDYVRTFGWVTFAAGETVKMVNVPILGDTTWEANETFTFNAAASSPSIASGSATCTIVNDDDPSGRRRTARH